MDVLPPAPPSPPVSGELTFRDELYERVLRPHSQSSNVRYVWVKVVEMPGGGRAFSPSRPPNAVVRTTLAADANQQTIEVARDIEVFYAVRDRWSFDLEDVPPGKPKFRVSYGPAFTSIDLAEAWFKGPASEFWKRGARACTLYSFASLQKYDGLPLDDDADSAVGMTAVVSCGRDGDRRPGGFPQSDWKSGYFIAANETTPVGRQVFDETALEALLDSDWDNRPDEVQECKVVAALVAKHRDPGKPGQTAAREAQITSQADGLNTCGALMLSALRKPLNATWPELSGLLSQAFEHILYRIKCRYNRKRPKHECKAEARPMFDVKADDLHPGHPSFPAGHATTAYLVATLLDRTFPGHTDKLMQIAGDITLNREIAGLHFRSDSDAGKKLGVAMAEMILDVKPSASKDPQMIANRKQLCDLVARL